MIDRHTKGLGKSSDRGGDVRRRSAEHALVTELLEAVRRELHLLGLLLPGSGSVDQFGCGFSELLHQCIVAHVDSVVDSDLRRVVELFVPSRACLVQVAADGLEAEGLLPRRIAGGCVIPAGIEQHFARSKGFEITLRFPRGRVGRVRQHTFRCGHAQQILRRKLVLAFFLELGHCQVPKHRMVGGEGVEDCFLPIAGDLDHLWCAVRVRG